MEHMDSDCAFYASVGFDEEGTKCVGWDEVKKGFASLWEGYPDAKFEPVGEDFFLVAIEVVANGFLRGQGKVTGEKVRARGCDVYTFRNGKIALKNSMRKQEP